MLGPFSKQDDGRGREEGTEIFYNDSKFTRRIEDLRMRDDPDKLINAWPQDRPRPVALCQFAKQLIGGGMVRKLLPTGMEKDVGVQRDQRRSSIQSKRASRSSSRTPGRNRPLSVLHWSL